MFIPRTLRDFGELVMMFNEMKVAIRVDSEAQTIEAGALRVRWDTSRPYLHLTQAILADVPVAKVALVESAIVRHNHDASLPVLDFDARTRTISFRVSTVVLVDGVRVDLVQALLGGIDARVEELRAELASLLD